MFLVSPGAICSATGSYPSRSGGIAYATVILSTAILVSIYVVSRYLDSFTTIAVGSLAVGTLVLIAAMGVTTGFEGVFHSKVLNVNSEILVTKYGDDFSEYRDISKRIEAQDFVKGTVPFVFKEMMISRKGRLFPLMVKGIDVASAKHVHLTVGDDSFAHAFSLATNSPASKKTSHMHDSRLEKIPNRGNQSQLFIGTELAESLDVKKGDVVKLLSPVSSNNNNTSNGSVANDNDRSSSLSLQVSSRSFSSRSRSFSIGGIFSAGFHEYDAKLAFIPLGQLRSFLSLPDRVTGIEVRTLAPLEAEIDAVKLGRVLGGPPFRTISWTELNRPLFKALVTQKMVMRIILAVIIIVGSFNLMSVLSMIAVRRRKEIALLGVMGMTPRKIVSLFFFIALFIWICGSLLGVSYAFLFEYLVRGGLIQLDSAVYLIQTIPVDISLKDIVATVLFSFAICVVASAIPALRAAKIAPIALLRSRT